MIQQNRRRLSLVALFALLLIGATISIAAGWPRGSRLAAEQGLLASAFQPRARAAVAERHEPDRPSAPRVRAQSVTPETPPEQVGGAYRTIEGAVIRIRGLQPSRQVDLRFMNQDELNQYLRQGFDREYTPAERARDQKLLTALGLIGPDQDLTTLMLGLLTEQVVGLYDEDTRRMYLIGDQMVPTAYGRVVFAHEFTHALQDEFYGLKTLNPPDSDNDDRSAAITALVEGDATMVMSIYARNELTVTERREYAQTQAAGSSSALDEAPLVLRTELLFPYSDGLRFVQALQRQGGFAAVDAAFRELPASTEQVIHPEKYFAHEAPVPVTVPDLAAALGGTWQQTVSNTLGELDLRILVEQYSSRGVAERAAAGWGGDRYVMLEDGGGRSAVVVRTSWDTPDDADEFFRAYAQSLRRRFPDGRLVDAGSNRQELISDSYATLVSLNGQEVQILIAPDEAIVGQLAQGLLGS